jgi:DNA-binding response OmpR family regulator
MSDPLHILVVDDEPRFRAMLRRYLVSEGFKISEAADGVPCAKPWRTKRSTLSFSI